MTKLKKTWDLHKDIDLEYNGNDLTENNSPVITRKFLQQMAEEQRLHDFEKEIAKLIEIGISKQSAITTALFIMKQKHNKEVAFFKEMRIKREQDD